MEDKQAAAGGRGVTRCGTCGGAIGTEAGGGAGGGVDGSTLGRCECARARAMAQQLTTAAGPRLVALAEVQRFVRECVAKAGAPDAHARAMASVLAEADRRGHFSHGLNRLDMYVNDLQSGLCDGAVTPRVLREATATAWVDGCNGLGPVVGTFCMELAIRKARETGVGWVAAKGSNHFGIAAWYSMMALKEKNDWYVFHQHFTTSKPDTVKTGGAGHQPAVAGGAGGGRRLVRAGHGHDGRRGGQDRGAAAARGAHPRGVGAGRERRRHHRPERGHERELPHAAGRRREHLGLQGLRPGAHGRAAVRRARRGDVRAGRAQVEGWRGPAG